MRRLRLWAFATSPHGLGLAPEVFWSLTATEFYALKEVHDQTIRRWAITQATLHNAHFQTDGVPYLAEDFLGTGDRNDRMKTKQRDNFDLLREQMSLARIVRGGPEPEGLPEWAKGQYRGLNG